jgi:hypothetical protein
MCPAPYLAKTVPQLWYRSIERTAIITHIVALVRHLSRQNRNNCRVNTTHFCRRCGPEAAIRGIMLA